VQGRKTAVEAHNLVSLESLASASTQNMDKLVRSDTSRFHRALQDPIVLNVADVMTKRPAIITTSPDENINSCLEVGALIMCVCVCVRVLVPPH
jgi:hypothetical protein